MYPILEKRLLAEGIWLMKVLAPRVARSARPGQFIIVRADEHGERIPLTISDFDAEEGSVTIVTQAIGASTRKICALEAGEALADFAGPLGHPSEFVEMPLDELRKRHYLFVAGGVGTAPVYPQVKWLTEHGVEGRRHHRRQDPRHADLHRRDARRGRKPLHRHRRRLAKASRGW